MMRSQLRFIMHPSDEREFAAKVLLEDSVYLIDGPRWKAQSPQVTRSFEQIRGSYCIIWSNQDRSVLSARQIPTCNDWYCDSEMVTIQFLRSQIVDSIITEGRIAISTDNAAEAEAKGVERRFKALVRFIKKSYRNSVACWYSMDAPFTPDGPGRSANPSKPDPQVWIGPHALQWLAQDPNRCIKQFTNSRVCARLIEAFFNIGSDDMKARTVDGNHAQ